jgi:transcriptional regulator with XRE-family HTH domain
MLVGDRLRALREAKNLSQGDIETRTGLKRSYVSRVENEHTVPSLQTLEKWACALEVPLYHLFYEGNKLPKPLPVIRPWQADNLWGTTGKEARELRRFRRALARMNERERELLLFMARSMILR